MNRCSLQASRNRANKVPCSSSIHECAAKSIADARYDTWRDAYGTGNFWHKFAFGFSGLESGILSRTCLLRSLESLWLLGGPCLLESLRQILGQRCRQRRAGKNLRCVGSRRHFLESLRQGPGR